MRKDLRRVMVELGNVYNRSAARRRQAPAGLIGFLINDLRNLFLAGAPLDPFVRG